MTKKRCDWNLLEKNEIEVKKACTKSKLEGTLENCVEIIGDVVIGKGTVIRSFSYIEGPVVIGEKCVIGPSAYIRPYTKIEDGCKIGFKVEIKNSIIMEGARVPHSAYIGDSIIGEYVNIGAGTMVANLRHDGKIIKGTGRKKAGVILEDHVKIGVNTSFYPGIRVSKNTKPGEIVKVDKCAE